MVHSSASASCASQNREVSTMSETPINPFTRREFIQTGAVLTAGLVLPTYAYASGSDTIKVGLIGCGGRGTGGIIQNLQSAPGIELIAMGDLLPERLARSEERRVGKE